LFANWAKTLLQDFNEIDRYLLDSSYVHLKDIEDIKKWGIEVEIRHNYLKIILIFEIIAQLLSNIIGHLLKKELAIKD
jgi:hypothetical protein